MIDWAKIILLGLRLVEAIFDFAKAQGYIQQGRDEEIARQTAVILAKTEYAKDVRTKIASMDDKALDTAIDDLVK